MSACERAEHATAPAPVVEKPQPLVAAPKPPVFHFVEPQPWKSSDGQSVVRPPDLADETWRALVNQTEPMQRKTPHWQSLPARETVELAMPAGSAFRCLVAPLSVRSHGDEYGKHLKAWLLKRAFICSSDDYRTWTETFLQIQVPADGPRKPGQEAGTLLRERAQDGTVHETFVLMRPDKEHTKATVGPPQIIADRAVDDE